LLVSADAARELPRDRVLILAGGTQAEKNSALRRLAHGVHPAFSLDPGDTVILSSRVIPGNERPVIAMINDLLRRGVIVKSRVTDPGVHTSGHAGRSEQRRMLSLVRPRCFMPVHGTLHHLLRHAELAEQVGIAERMVVENGTPVLCDGERLTRDAEVRSGRVPIAFGGEPLDRPTLQARSDLSRNGVVLACLVFAEDGLLAAPPRVAARGVPSVDAASPSLRAVSLELERAVGAYREGRGLSLEEFLRRTARRKLEELSGTRPVVELELVRLGD
jgi:ribonuclease J